jgi:hypothetical protein
MSYAKLTQQFESILIFVNLMVAVIWPFFMFICLWADADSGPSGYSDKWYFHLRIFLLPVAFVVAPLAFRLFGLENRWHWTLGIQTVLALLMLSIAVDMVLTPHPWQSPPK